MSERKKFFKFVIPSVLAFTLSGVYTIVDGLFIGQSLGDRGLASINLGYPITAVIQAFGTGIGLSGAIRFTILNAKKKEKDQKVCFGGTVLLMLLVSGLITALLLSLLHPLLRLLGADGEILQLTAEYIHIIALGAVFQLLATGLVPFIRNMGSAAFAMGSMMAGFAINIVLDYFFIIVNNWGMAGAARATIMGQAATMLAAVIFLAAKKFRVLLPSISELPSLWGTILKVSVAPFGLTFTPVVAMMLMNRFLLLYGNEVSIATYGCISYAVSMIYLFLQGIGDGSQPLISQYYGENNIVTMKRIRTLAYRSASVLTAICVIGLFLARNHIGLLFGASPEASRGVAACLPLFLATMLPLAFVRITTAYFYATEKTILSYVLVYAEPVLIFILLLTIPHMIDLLGVWLATPLAQLITWCISICAKHKIDRRMLR